MGLARSRGWQSLLHYRPKILGGVASEVDGREFFLSPTGRTDPQAELEATLRAFFLPFHENEADGHALCRFPARRRWLDERLHFAGTLHAPTCPALDRYLGALEPEAIAVVYSAPYLGNAVSAFGHTFLRIRKARPAGATEPGVALDYGVDFIAIPDTKNPFLYVYRGIAGVFPGVVRFHSYAYKAREYGVDEGRDLWEYDLALTHEEAILVSLHLFELAATHLEFFYFRNNCSYGILSIVEAGAPRIDLLSRLDVIVVPKDTIRAIAGVPGLVRVIGYRPSAESVRRAETARLEGREADLVKRLLRDPSTPAPPELSPAETASALDVAISLVDGARTSSSAGGGSTAAATWASLVTRRALLSGNASPPPAPTPVPADKAPHLAPASMRLTVGDGATTQYRSDFLALGYRLVFHDLADPPDGSSELSQVQFLEAQLRYDLGRRTLTLDHVTFADLVSLDPLTRFEKPLSWRVRAFAMRPRDRACPDCLEQGLEGGVGATLASDSQRVALFVMADAYVLGSSGLHGIGGSFVRAGVGPYGGVRLHLPGHTVALVTGGWSYLPGSSLVGTYDLGATVRCELGRDVALGAEARVQPLSTEALLTSYFYF